MSDVWVNIRFGVHHLQIGYDWPWIRWSRNDFHADKANRTADWTWCQVHELRLPDRLPRLPW